VFTRRLAVLNDAFLDQRALGDALPGVMKEQRRRLFFNELEHSIRFEAYRQSFASRPGPVEPLADGWHPWTAIASLDDREEAIWLAYLTTFFGPDERRHDTWRATRVVYSAFGSGRPTFSEVQSDDRLLPRLCHANAQLFRSLPRGNHRKYEPKDADHKLGLLASVDSLLGLAARHGGLLRWFTDGTSPSDRFERLMSELRIVSFGRTGRFDLLTLVGDLGVVELTAPRLYLKGATGPLEGARQAIPGVRDEAELDRRLEKVVDAFGISGAVLEDALCNWQKHL
jgi:hypothetical protein